MDGGATPVPVSAIVCGLPFALSVMETLLVKSPSVVGANVTLIVHVVPFARLEPHVLVWSKGGATAIPSMLSLPEPVLLNVMASSALIASTA